MKATVDKDACIGCGLCESICPSVFSMDEDGKAVAAAGELPEDDRASAEDAAAQCPTEAIKVE